MTLVACPECDREVSDQGRACVHCGYPFTGSMPSTARVLPATPVGQQPAQVHTVGLRLSRATSTFLWVTAGLYLVAAAAFAWYLFVWIDWAGQRDPSAAATQNAADAETAAYGFLGIGFIGYAAAGVLFIVWFFQSYRAAASRGATARTWASGWTIGGWFIPLANFVIPKLVMNEVDRMSNPEAGDPPIEDRWRSLPRLELSDMWWALFVLGSLTTAIGSNWLPIADVKGADYATALVMLAGGLVATAGSGIAGGRMVRSVGERLHEPQQAAYRAPIVAGEQPEGAVHATGSGPWVRGYDWVGYQEQTVRCLSCEKDVSFPAEQKRHSTHKIAASDRGIHT